MPGLPGSRDLTSGLVTCPICRTPQSGRYCEECGYDFVLTSTNRPQAQLAPTGSGFPAAPQAPTPAPPAPGSPAVPPQPPTPPAPYGSPGPYEAAEPYQGGAQPSYQRPVQPVSFEKASLAPPAAAPPVANQQPPVANSQPPAPGAQSFPDQDDFEPTGPVYARTGPATPGDEFGTSFRLAPPQPPAAPPAPAPPRVNWIAVVAADRDYFTDMMTRSGPEAAGLFFPPYCPERRIPLTGRGQIRIGRRSQQRGTVPEIDLSVPPEDPGASHQHALLAEQPDGSWVLVDQDSTNGTTVNGSPDAVPPHTAIPLNDGDRIHIGAWTTITLHRA